MRHLFYIILLMCVSCVGREALLNREKDAQSKSAIKVRTITMHKSTDMRTRSYVGQAKASKSATLTAPYSGTVRNLEASVGEHVSEGDRLAEIHSESVKSAHDMTQATLRQAEDGYARITKAKGTVTPLKLKEVETDLAKAKAAASAAEDALNSGNIKAPFDGIISAVYIHDGAETVLSQPLVKIISPSDIEIVFSVPEGELNEIYEGMSAEVDVPALNEEGIPAQITTKGVEASPVSHTYECTLKLMEPVDELAPGMVCKVALGKDMQPDYIVPARVIQTDRNGRYVWMVSNNVVQKAYVTVGGFAGNGVIVTDGLSDGDLVISEGFRKVSSGMKVEEVADMK